MISREEAVKHLEDIRGFVFDHKWKESMDMAIEALSQPERPKGRWIETCMADVYQCSNCKKATKMDEFCDSDVLRNFCPNCGADMRGEEE